MGQLRVRTSVIVVHQGQILGFHAKDPTSGKDYFFLPGGKIEPNETAEESVIRETLEETGYSIRLLPGFIDRTYDFEWNGKINHCETRFFKAQLINTRAQAVSDADYHQGVDWIGVGDIKKVFAYHSAILDAVLELLEEN